MNVKISENQIRERANEQSFQKGQEYYQVGAIFNPTWQPTPGGILLMASCEGSSAPSYQISAMLDAAEITTVTCTCPYDWGGDCKHIVALLLTYHHHPEVFAERKSVDELLSGLEKEALAMIIARLVVRDPDLYDELEAAILAAKAAPRVQSPGPKNQFHTQVSEQDYRKQVRRILKQSRYEDNGYGSAPAYLDDLEDIQKTAVQFLDAGDPQGALIIFRVLLEETADDYENEADYEGYVAAFIQDLGMPLAEAILSVEMDEKSRQDLHDMLDDIFEGLDESIEESDLDVASAALEYAWEELPDEETQWEEYDEETWMRFRELQQARLNVLERQGRTNEFLQLAQKTDLQRFTLKLIQIGRVDDAIAASRELAGEYAILSVAQALRDAGQLDDAITLAERELNRESKHGLELAAWLAPLEEARGNRDKALYAYRVAFDAQPSITWYRHLKQLSGIRWNDLRTDLLKKVDESQNADTLADIYLEEREWDSAIAIAEKPTWDFSILGKVADGLIPHRPDWVIRVSLKQSDQLIAKTQSKLYPEAANWLSRAKQAYLAKGQSTEWQAYISRLRDTYARRPALQKALANL